MWADLGDGVPDGIWVDADNAVYGDVPDKRCVRVREGGEVLSTIKLDRGCFACMLGGANKRALFMIAAEWRGPAKRPTTHEWARTDYSGAEAGHRVAIGRALPQLLTAGSTGPNVLPVPATALQS